MGAAMADDDEVVRTKGGELQERNDALIAVVQAADGADPIAEVTFRRSRVGTKAKPIVICEVCVTTIDPDTGTRTTICTPIDCPKTVPNKPPKKILV
jgi:hypothetical protein